MKELGFEETVTKVICVKLKQYIKPKTDKIWLMYVQGEPADVQHFHYSCPPEFNDYFCFILCQVRYC